MIIQPNSENDKRKLALLQQDTELTPTEASGSNAPSPPFAVDAHTVNEATPFVHSTSSDMELGPPPEFTPYHAEQIEQSNRDIVSHDPHLNFDGEALYRFLLSQSQTPPTYRVHCCGKHDERRTRWVTERDSHGHSRMRAETYTETVVDFDFFIDVLPEATEGRDPATWSINDDEPAYRGKMVREYEGSSSPTTGSLRQKATREQVKEYKAWAARRSRTGLHPWIRQEDLERGFVDIPALSHMDGLKSSKTIRQWADEYCASPKYLKEFVYEKVLYGWDIDQLETAIRSTIKAVPYNGSLTVDIAPRGSKVYVRPDNKVSRMLSNMWLKFLSIILLIFPFIWLFKRFHSRGGGRWEVCGAAYPLKQWVPLDNGEDIPLGTEAASEELPIYSPIATGSSSPLPPRSRNNSSRFMQTPSGPKKLVGLREGEWFRAWEGTIRHAVIGRYQSNDPLLPHSRSRPEVELLDGYNTAPPLIEY